MENADLRILLTNVLPQQIGMRFQTAFWQTYVPFNKKYRSTVAAFSRYDWEMKFITEMLHRYVHVYSNVRKRWKEWKQLNSLSLTSR